MTAKIKATHFSGAGNVHTSREDGLAAVVRGLAQDIMRMKVNAASLTDFTDNSTGVAAATVATMVIPSAEYDGSSSGASPAAAFNTAAGVIENACAVFADALEDAYDVIGLSDLTYTTGTVAVAWTIPAMTKALTATSGATAIEYDSGVDRMEKIAKNIATLQMGVNELATAVGEATIGGSTGYDPYWTRALAAIADASASSDGADSISDTVMDTFLDAAADNVASLAAKVTAIIAAVAASSTAKVVAI